MRSAESSWQAKENSRRPGFFFVICRQEVKRLVLNIFTLYTFLGAKDAGTHVHMKGQVQSPRKLTLFFSILIRLQPVKWFFEKLHMLSKLYIL